uniref:Uncharacterized protein n=1 Tax=Anguilla anguilla TaxID=7936 RepID=A0A0E9ST69_ANGAN
MIEVFYFIVFCDTAFLYLRAIQMY